MIGQAIAAAALTSAGMIWTVRGRASTIFGPSRWRGSPREPVIALTFDDGPSESTPELLDILARHGARATFFQCGAHVRRLTAVAREVHARGHEIANHTDTHPYLCFRPPPFIRQELTRAQDAIAGVTGAAPSLFRAPFGVRWFGLRQAQRQLGLTGVMWSTLGCDWKLRGAEVSARLLRGASNGAIFCLHDGRRLQHKPDIRETLLAVTTALPQLQERGFRFVTVSEMLCRIPSKTISPSA